MATGDKDDSGSASGAAGSDAPRAKGSDAGPTGTTSKSDKTLPPAAKRKKKTVGVTAPSPSASTSRYTPPVPAAKRGPSPRWVPVLMFGLWAVGLGMILLNYMGLLPGSSDGGNGFYLVGGLVAILGGIITATQYR